MADKQTGPQWDHLGQSIQELIDNAINQQNYQELSRNIGNVIDNAFSAGSDALHRAGWAVDKDKINDTIDRAMRYGASAVQNASQRVQPKVTVERTKAPLPALYGSTNGETTKGILKTVFGSLLSIVGLAMGLSFGVFTLVISTGYAAGFCVGAGILGGGLGLLSSGISSLARVSRYKVYLKTLGQKTYIALDKLARSVGKNEKFVRKELQKMISQGFFLEGHLDKEQKNLITSDETYAHYEQAQAEYEKRKQDKAQEDKKTDPKIQEVLDRGNAYVAQIRRCNDEIPGEEISAKIDRMEQIVRKIFERAESHPEIIPDLKRLMDYYLPMTVKLLNAYADMDRQPVQGETIQKSKAEIDATLDTLNAALEKLLDSVFEDTALDVSSDISVLNTLLAQEGLTGSDFDLNK